MKNKGLAIGRVMAGGVRVGWLWVVVRFYLVWVVPQSFGHLFILHLLHTKSIGVWVGVVGLVME